MSSSASPVQSRSACLWVLPFSNGFHPCEFTVYAYTAAQARRKLKAVIRQARDGKPSLRTFEGPYSGGLKDILVSKELQAPNYEGKQWRKYGSLDEMVETAFLDREDYRDVSLHTALDG